MNQYQERQNWRLELWKNKELWVVLGKAPTAGLAEITTWTYRAAEELAPRTEADSMAA